MTKSNYNKLIITICATMASFLIVIVTCYYKIFHIDMISPDDFKYWSSYKFIAIIFSICFVFLLIVFVLTLICKYKASKNQKLMAILLILVILATVILSSTFSYMANKNSFSEHIQNQNALPENFCNLNYFKDLDVTYNIQTIKNCDAKLTIATINNGSKELSYYELETANSVLPYIFEISLLGIATNINHDSINPENKIEGLDYYIYETNLYYSYDQIPSHSQIEIFAKVNKSPDYTMNDFEQDILKIRNH